MLINMSESKEAKIAHRNEQESRKHKDIRRRQMKNRQEYEGEKEE